MFVSLKWCSFISLVFLFDIVHLLSMFDKFVLIDDEEEYEESDKGSCFLGFMFGNVDNSGDLDVDYLDEVI